MNRSVALLLAVLIALSLCACSSAETPASEGASVPEKTLAPCVLSSASAATPIPLGSSRGTIRQENQAARAANAEALYAQYLQQYPDYAYGGYLDLDRDGVDELILSVMGLDRDMVDVTLCAINSDGNRVLSWKLYSQSGLQYEPLTRSLVVSAGGTGVLEYCLVHPEGNQLAVHRIGYNATRPEWDTPRFYDCADQISGGSEVKLTYNWGDSASSFEPNMDFLNRYAIDELDWTVMAQYFTSLSDVILPSR